jgi:hypothetical protein
MCVRVPCAFSFPSFPTRMILRAVTNLMPNRTGKCNQAIIVGFGDNDHMVRELMRFIKMTSE